MSSNWTKPAFHCSSGFVFGNVFHFHPFDFWFQALKIPSEIEAWLKLYIVHLHIHAADDIIKKDLK